MAYEKNRIKLPYATKDLIEGELKDLLLENELVYSIDTFELGVKNSNGTITYISSSGVDLDELSYLNRAANNFYDNLKNDKLKDAWEDMLEVDIAEIEKTSTTGTQYGKLQYPNGEINGVIIPYGTTSIGNIAFYDWEANNQPLVIPNSVTSIGDYAFYNWTTNDQLLVIPNSVTGIGNGAFAMWTSNNQPLVIPNSVTSIGDNAFINWESNDQPLVIPNSITSIGNYVFRDWTSNNQPLVIPNSVTGIGNGAFAMWTSNNQPLVIPNSITSIGAGAFSYWYQVPYIIIEAATPPTLSNSGAFAGQNNAPIYVPDESVAAYKTATNWADLADRIFPISAKTVDLTEIEQDITNLETSKQDKLVAGENITIDENTNVISASGGGGGDGIDFDTLGYMNYAADIYYRGGHQSLFSNAWLHSLTVDALEISENSSSSSPRGTAQYPNGETEGVIIPHGVTTIGNNAFNGWSANNQPLVIPNSVTSIGNNTFRRWESNNQQLVIPDGVTSIGVWAFSGWTSNNQQLVIPKSATSISTGAFYEWSSNNQPLVISNGITSIGERVFYGWKKNNQPLVIPNTVTSIGYQTFYNWSSNTHQLVIPNSVTVIGYGAFQTWTANNQPLVIPESVTSIGDYAFYGWSKVPYVIMERTTPPTLVKSRAFDYQNNAPIYVPDESVNAYKTATNWVNLASRIFPISDKVVDIDDIEDLKSDIQTIEQNINGLENNKVDKVVGKGLSTNDFTDVLKNKLDGIETGAEKNTVLSVSGKTGNVVLAKADVGLGSVQNYAIASQAQAEAGTANNLYMTPLRTKELITVVMGDIESALDAILGV